MPEENFVTCTTCEDYDLCIPCHLNLEHGHHPKHAFAPAVEDANLDLVAKALLAPGRNARHHAVCDGCDKVCEEVPHFFHSCLLITYSTSTAFVTSASTAQIGITAPPALSTPVSSILAIDLSQSTNLSTIHQPCIKHITASPVTMASTVMDLFAILLMGFNLTLEETVTSVLFATIRTFVLIARPARRIFTTRLTHLSSLRLLYAMSVLRHWAITRMVSQWK